jgi:ferredoxin
MRYRIQIDRSLCSGFGSCVDAAPGAFGLGDDSIAVVREGLPNDGVLDARRGPARQPSARGRRAAS